MTEKGFIAFYCVLLCFIVIVKIKVFFAILGEAFYCALMFQKKGFIVFYCDSCNRFIVFYCDPRRDSHLQLHK